MKGLILWFLWGYWWNWNQRFKTLSGIFKGGANNRVSRQRAMSLSHAMKVAGKVLLNTLSVEKL